MAAEAAAVVAAVAAAVGAAGPEEIGAIAALGVTGLRVPLPRDSRPLASRARGGIAAAAEAGAEIAATAVARTPRALPRARRRSAKGRWW